jgi:hypothetical protein
VDLVFNLYDENEKPTCYKNGPDMQLPAILKIISFTINITKQLNTTGIPGTTRLMLTAKKNDFLIGYICKV